MSLKCTWKKRDVFYLVLFSQKPRGDRPRNSVGSGSGWGHFQNWSVHTAEVGAMHTLRVSISISARAQIGHAKQNLILHTAIERGGDSEEGVDENVA